MQRKKTRDWDRQGKYRTSSFYHNAHDVAQHKSRQHWHAVRRAQALSGTKDPGVWDAKVRPRITAKVSCKFEDVHHTTVHAEKRARQRHIRPGTQVHTVIDDRTGTLITAWSLSKQSQDTRRQKGETQLKSKSKGQPRKESNKRKQQREKQQQHRVKKGEQRLQSLIRGAVCKQKKKKKNTCSGSQMRR